MKTLHLVLKSKWYDMIASGIKTEEYREIKPYWIKRIFYDSPKWKLKCDYPSVVRFLCRFNFVTFHQGYSDITMTYPIDDILIGKGKPEWGAPNENVFIIKLGRRIE